MNRQRMISIKNTPGPDDGCRYNTDSLVGIYIDLMVDALSLKSDSN